MIEIIGYGVLSFLLVGLYRWLALRFRWLDHPNQRSSHRIVTPRGAGIIFASLIIGATAWLLREQPAVFSPLLIGVAIALTGWWDDIRGTASTTRFTLYVLSAATAAALALTLDKPQAALITLLGYGLLGTLGLAWLINLYNFMDGINGLAALEAIFVLLATALLAADTPYAHTFSWLHFFSCAALVGFLLWNFPLGKVFMGDAGSAFLGFFLGILILLSCKIAGPKIAVWFILLAIFIADTTWVLLVRIATRQRWYEAHRSHAYQYLTRRMQGSHARATGILMTINVCWLFPMAWLVQNNALGQTYGLALAYFPLLIMCYWFKAGIPQQGHI